MYEKASLERFKKISEIITSILAKCKNGISEALQDEDILQPAILMQFVRINELIQGIQKNNDTKALCVFDKQEIGAFNKTRNIILHEYEALDLELLEDFIKHLPILQERLDNSIKEYYVNLDSQNESK
ncbi:MAG: 2-isopropylmalate synthase [Campylobacter sp.]|nr:2-isopropylmalate synthase [Campylobacter sp.]